MGGWSGELQPTRRAAMVMWATGLAALLLMFAASSYAGPSFWEHHDLAPAAWLAALVAAAAFAGGRLVPPRLRPAGAGPAGLAFIRCVTPVAVSEGAGLLGCLAWMLTGSAWAAAAVALSLLGVVLSVPSPGRWARLGAEVAGGESGAR